MKKLLKKHPILNGILAIIVIFILTQIISIPFTIIGNIIGYGNDAFIDAFNYIAEAIGALISVLIFNSVYKKKGFKGAFKFNKGNLKDVYVGLLLVVAVDIACFIFSSLLLEGGFKALVLPSFYTFGLALCAGILEETVFRAIPIPMMMRNNADDKRIIMTVVVTALIFGLVHVSNMLDGAILSTTLLQVVAATITGILYAGIYLRSGSILLPMLVHFSHDLLNFMLPAQATGIMTQTSFSLMELIPEVAMMIIELGVGLYILKKVHFKEIKESWKNKWSE